MTSKTKNILHGIAGSIILISIIVAGGLIEKDSEEYYTEHTKIAYCNEEYNLKDLYLLHNDTENHICKIEDIQNVHEFFMCNADKHSSYVDLKTNEEIALKDHEEDSGYLVDKIINYFPFEYFKQDNFFISEEELYQVLNLEYDELLKREI